MNDFDPDDTATPVAGGHFTSVAECPGCKAVIVVLSWPRDPGRCWVCDRHLKWSHECFSGPANTCTTVLALA